MLNQRQIGIILEMSEHPEKRYTAEYFAKKNQTSLRTSQSDLKTVKTELEDSGAGKILAERGKGSFLSIEKHNVFSEWVNKLYLHHSVGDSFSYPMQRAAQILFILLERYREVPLHEMESTLYVSRSTLANDLKLAQEILDGFQMTLVKKDNRLSIIGSEISKRQCLAENSLYLAGLQGMAGLQDKHSSMETIAYLKNVLLDAFLEYQYYISDTDFNNGVLMLNMILHRVRRSFFIKQGELDSGESRNMEKELTISAKVFAQLEKHFHFNVPLEEIEFFAIYLKGQEILKNHDIITQDMDEFIIDAFYKIKQNYGVDFVNNINLRIAVALHCIPLIVRLKYHMQVRSKNLADVKRNFPLGYEIAQYFSYLLRQKYASEAKMNDDEIALLSAHFYGSILELKQAAGRKRVLVITSIKSSMVVLLRSILMKWFNREIIDLEFEHEGDVTEIHLEKFDIFLTTDKNAYYENGLAMYISPFPSESDRKNISLLLDGFSCREDVLQVFQRHIFFSLEHGTKEGVLEILTRKAEKEYQLQGLHRAVLEREAIGSTFFSCGIALAHPISALSSDTFVGVCIVKEPVLWDEEGHSVQMVLLIHIGKNNPRSFQLWDYLSHLFDDKKMVSEIAEDPTYERTMDRIGSLLTSQFA